MAKYLVLEKSFINSRIVEAGETVDYDGEPGPNLELVKDTAKKQKPKDAEGSASDEGQPSLV